MSRRKYEDGHIFDSGVQLINRNYSNGKEWYCNFKCPYCSNVFVSRLSHVARGDIDHCGCQTKYNQKQAGKKKAKIKNLIGQRFGRLVVLKDSGKRTRGDHGGVIWTCKCDCGTILDVASSSLVAGDTRSCGCLLKENAIKNGKASVKNLVGQKFGMLTVIRDSTLRYNTKTGSEVIWTCKCECGTIKNFRASCLKKGDVKSCGCLKTSYLVQCIKNILTRHEIEYITEKSFDDCINPITKHKLFFDFYLPKYNCCIEYDGIQHFKSVEYFGGEQSLIETQYRDSIKDEYCKNNNITLFRISYKDNNVIDDDFILSLLKNI